MAKILSVLAESAQHFIGPNQRGTSLLYRRWSWPNADSKPLSSRGRITKFIMTSNTTHPTSTARLPKYSAQTKPQSEFSKLHRIPRKSIRSMDQQNRRGHPSLTVLGISAIRMTRIQIRSAASAVTGTSPKFVPESRRLPFPSVTGRNPGDGPRHYAVRERNHNQPGEQS